MSSNLNTVARANLRASKGKYILTGLGIAISSFFIAAVIVLISSLQGTVSASIGDVLTKADNIVISAGANNQSNNSANIYLDEETIKKIRKTRRLLQPGLITRARVSSVPIRPRPTTTRPPPAPTHSPSALTVSCPRMIQRLCSLKSSRKNTT